MDIEEIVAPVHTENISRRRLDSCCCEMRTLSILPRSLSHRDSATYHLSNHFRIRTPSLLFSKVCFSLAGSVEKEECGVRSAECGKYGVWKMQSVESVEI